MDFHKTKYAMSDSACLTAALTNMCDKIGMGQSNNYLRIYHKII